MKFINKLEGLSPIYDSYTKKHIYNLPNINKKLEYSFCNRLNSQERRKLPNGIPGIYILGLNFTTNILNPFFSPVYVGSSVDIRDRLQDHTKIFRFEKRAIHKCYEQALEQIPQQYWYFVWATCPDYKDIERDLIKTLFAFTGVYLLNKQHTGSYSTGIISLEKWTDSLPL
jgi:hypothetical protein